MAPTVLAMRTQSLVGAPVQRRQLTQLSAGQPLVRLPQLQQHRVAVRVGIVTMAAAATEEAVTTTAAPQENAEAVAHLRYYRMQPSKIRVILDQIRGRTYEDALMILEYMPHRACEPILKLLVSAAANAKQNLGLRKSKLVVSECYANEGPVLKRFEPRAKGRAYRINKYLTHITIKVAESA